MARLTHTGKVTNGVCLLRIYKVPERSYVVNGDRYANVFEASHTGTAITQYNQLTSLDPSPSSVCLNAPNIQRRLHSAPIFGNELIRARSIAESSHFIPAGVLARFPWRSFKILSAIRACVLNVIDESPAFSWPYLSFIWTGKAKAMLIPYRMRSIVGAVLGSPLAMARLAAKTRLGQAIVRYRILDPALNTVLDWHVVKIVNKTYHGGSMSIAIACDALGFDLTLCEIDADYFKAGKARYEAWKAQPLFDERAPEPVQLTAFA